jgi:hypothetical protein
VRQFLNEEKQVKDYEFLIIIFDHYKVFLAEGVGRRAQSLDNNKYGPKSGPLSAPKNKEIAKKFCDKYVDSIFHIILYITSNKTVSQFRKGRN